MILSMQFMIAPFDVARRSARYRPTRRRRRVLNKACNRGSPRRWSSRAMRQLRQSSARAVESESSQSGLPCTGRLQRRCRESGRLVGFANPDEDSTHATNRTSFSELSIGPPAESPMIRSPPILKPETPTGEKLRREVDAGASRGKVAFQDPAIAPLGADAEAGGAAPSDQPEPGLFRRFGPDQDGEMAARPDGGVAISWGSLVFGGLAFGLAGGFLVALRFG
jgi:hypothetical protein